MAAPISPGDFVECVHARTCGCGCVPGGGPLYYRTRIYRVADTCDHLGPGRGVMLAEVDVPAPHHCFPVRDFRPVYRPSADLFESLKAPPVRVREPA